MAKITILPIKHENTSSILILSHNKLKERKQSILQDHRGTNSDTNNHKIYLLLSNISSLAQTYSHIQLT